MTHLLYHHGTTAVASAALPCCPRPGLPAMMCAMALLFQNATAQAADTAALNVTGKILPAPCTVNLANDGNASFGRIPKAALSDDGQRKIVGERNVGFTISCTPANAPLLSFKDERHHSVPAFHHTSATSGNMGEMFGLGRLNETDLGAYQMRFSSLRGDGQDVKAAHSRDGKAPWTFIDMNDTIRKDQKYVWSASAQPQPGRFGTISGELNIRLMPEPASQLPLRGKLEFDGSTTLVLEYP